MIELYSDLENIDTIATSIIEKLDTKTIIFLNGNLASGKTTLTQALIKKLNNSEQTVTSPTFSISINYPNGIFHYDLYNKSIEEFINLGLFEQLDLPKLHIIEWAPQKLKELIKEYGYEAINIDISQSENGRTYRITDA